jgi:dienelactone hydrolase
MSDIRTRRGRSTRAGWIHCHRAGLRLRQGAEWRRTEALGAGVGQAIQGLTPNGDDTEMTARLNAAMAYGKSLPSSNGKTAVIGFCWGGTRSFQYAIAQPELSGAIVYYGSPTGAAAAAAPEAALAKIKAPVIGMYGGSDDRITSTVSATEAAMKKLGKSYEPHIFEGAGTASWATRRPRRTTRPRRILADDDRVPAEESWQVTTGNGG